jgi:mannose-1-phosphate guanylyltransferase
MAGNQLTHGRELLAVKAVQQTDHRVATMRMAAAPDPGLRTPRAVRDLSWRSSASPAIAGWRATGRGDCNNTDGVCALSYRNQNTWSVVLAAGDGTRLAALTADAEGNPVPKQFCSLAGDGSLLQDAIGRDAQVAPREQVCTVVSAQHHRYWGPMLSALSAENVIVQPRNCGTANGVLLALMRILDRDPLANIVFLPADHYVQHELVLALGLTEMVNLLGRHPHQLLLLGIEPEEVDPDLGYIVPGHPEASGVRGVLHFVAKPPAHRARALLEPAR